MEAELDFLDHLELESARFAEAISSAPPQARVPSCPDWDADDLLWHLAEVQWFWATIVRERVTDAPGGDVAPPRPADRAGLAAFFDRASRELADVLAATPPDTPAWTWSKDQTVGFMYGGLPPWGSFTPSGPGMLRLRASDTGHTWLVATGRFTGTDPGDGKSYDEPDIDAADRDPGDPAAAEVVGTAADLDCWLWHRPAYTPVTPTGDPEVLARFESAIAPGID